MQDESDFIYKNQSLQEKSKGGMPFHLSTQAGSAVKTISAKALGSGSVVQLHKRYMTSTWTA